ncbi:MAG: hypothetical protein HQ474_08955 [Flammeovirgaceae bacterium]|jgi:hypothetical protein|nr:hypothetical protein [Flammeovirgaceae bacterium]|tara:strand:+ start:11746 stop:11979 length:234 start_codon:yes stop_codon:yes gene_type:complete
MIRVLLIIFIIIYVVYKVSGFFLKIMFIRANQSQKGASVNTNKRSAVPNSNLNIDHIPKKEDKDVQGGDYVDYEEIK